MNRSTMFLAASAMGIGALMSPAGLSADCGMKHCKEQSAKKAASATTVEVIRIRPVSNVEKCAPKVKKTVKAVKFEKSAKLMKCEPVAVKPVAVKPVAVKCVKEVDSCKFADIGHAGDLNYIPVSRTDFWFKSPEDRFSCGANENMTDAANWAQLRQIQCGNVKAKVSTACIQPASCPAPCAPKTFYSQRVSMCPKPVAPQPVAACPPPAFRPVAIRIPTVPRISFARSSAPCALASPACVPVRSAPAPARPVAFNGCVTGTKINTYNAGGQTWGNQASFGNHSFGSGETFYPDRMTPVSSLGRYVDSSGNMHTWTH